MSCYNHVQSRFAISFFSPNGVANVLDDSGHELLVTMQRSTIDEHMKGIPVFAREGDKETISQPVSIHAHTCAKLFRAVFGYKWGLGEGRHLCHCGPLLLTDRNSRSLFFCGWHYGGSS
jgi:hypothetical protein